MSKKQNKPNDSMVFFRSFYEAIKDYPSKARADAVFAILEYALYGKVPQNKNYSVMSAYSFAKPVIDNTEKRRKCNKENGKKGGAPKGNTNACKKPLQTTDKQSDITEIQPKSTEIQPKNNLNRDMDKNKDMDMDKEVYMYMDTNDDSEVQYKKEPDKAGYVTHTLGEYENVLLDSIEATKLMGELGYDGYKKSVEYLSRYLKRKPDYKSACHFEDIRGWVQDAVRKEEKAKSEARKDEERKKNDPFDDISFEDIYER